LQNQSPVRAHILSRELLEQLKGGPDRWFIKPRFGIASFGAFSLTQDIKWSDLETLQKEMLTDPAYKVFFEKDASLIVESLIPGREFSLEVCVGFGQSVILAAHEKIELESKLNTTLENACVSPPFDLTNENIEALNTWLNKTLRTLNVTEGTFHIEARLDNENWELIEINSRVGGAYILESSKQVSGVSLLTAWINLTLEKNPKLRRDYVGTLKSSAAFSPHQTSLDNISFFRVYFADSGKTISDIEIQSHTQLQPVLSKCFLKPRTEVTQSSREIFLGQALWNPKRDLDVIKNLLEESRNYFKVSYLGGAQ
jgi:hypothetical protein